jgi:hypothetical protein
MDRANQEDQQFEDQNMDHVNEKLPHAAHTHQTGVYLSISLPVLETYFYAQG